jgi:histidinol-phosphate aminotransferase
MSDGPKSPPLHLVRDALAGLAAYRTPPDPPPIKLDANESPWPLPAEARARLAERLAEAELHRYPDLSAREVKRLIAARLGARPEELVLGVGSDEVIGMLMTSLAQPRARAARPAVVVPTPSFVMIPLTARVHGLEPIEVPLADDWSLDRPAMLAAIAEHRPNLVYLVSPNNPTGNALSDDEVRAMVEAAPESLVIIDEAYGPFAGASRGAWCERHPHVAVLGTLSKVGLAGLRVGWARMHPELAAQVEKARPPYNLNTYAQLAVQVILGELPHVLDDALARIVRERERLSQALSALPDLRVWPSEANFLLVESDEAEALHAALLATGIGVRRFASAPRLARHLRITVGTPEENDALVDALRHTLAADARRQR